MNQAEFYEKVRPEWWDWRERAMESAECVYLSAFTVAFIKEAMWRLEEVELFDVDHDWDADREKFGKFFDEVDPKWFVEALAMHSKSDEDAGLIFVNRDGEAYEYFNGLLEAIRLEWCEKEGGDACKEE